MEEVGTESGPELRLLQRQILTADPALACASASAAGPPGAGPQQPSWTVVPRQLPAPLAHFAGRAHELAELSGLLDRPRDEVPATLVIYAIGGTAGVGKTALALHWAPHDA